jgi:polyhydroxyalkanoate synthesis regulator phasin
MDDLKAKLAEDKALQAQVLDILKTTDIGKAYAETIAKNYFEENISQEHKKIYDFVDNALTSVGLEKPSGVKTSDWAKMIAEQNKELSDKLETLKSNTNPDESLKKLEELKAKHKKEKADLTNTAQQQIQEREQLIQSLKTKERNLTMSTEINGSLSKLEFNKGLDQALINDIIKLKTQTLIANAVEEDGKTIWCKPDGTAYKDGILNASLETILQNELQSVLHKNTQGGGAGNTPTASGDFNGSQVIVQEATFKTQEQFLSEFDKIAQRKGIPKGDEYNKLYWEAFERYNVSTLREY